jgi:hypothetical protein
MFFARRFSDMRVWPHKRSFTRLQENLIQRVGEQTKTLKLMSNCGKPMQKI